MSLTPEEIESNYNKLRSLCEKLGDRAPAALALVDGLGERLALCPASAKTDFHNAFAGGLIEHSLRVLGNANTIAKAFGWKLPKDSLIIGTLFHDLGKVGDAENDYYIPQTDAWRRDKLGEVYGYNKTLDYMSVPQRGLWLCQHFGLRLTQDETKAILLNDGMYADENKSYALKEGMLATVVHMADLIATKQEKGLLP